jgi:hypothetical protein
MNAHQLLFTQRQFREKSSKEQQVKEIKKNVADTVEQDPINKKPTVKEILECVEEKEAKTAIELVKRYMETFKQAEYAYKFN